MIKLWRPDRVEWHNRWGPEEKLNEFVAEGWRILAILPPDPWSEVPTVVLQNRATWRPRWKLTRWQHLTVLWRYSRLGRLIHG
jgi:hypothetical protein